MLQVIHPVSWYEHPCRMDVAGLKKQSLEVSCKSGLLPTYSQAELSSTSISSRV